MTAPEQTSQVADDTLAARRQCVIEKLHQLKWERTIWTTMGCIAGASGVLNAYGDVMSSLETHSVPVVQTIFTTVFIAAGIGSMGRAAHLEVQVTEACTELDALPAEAADDQLSYPIQDITDISSEAEPLDPKPNYLW